MIQHNTGINGEKGKLGIDYLLPCPFCNNEKGSPKIYERNNL